MALILIIIVIALIVRFSWKMEQGQGREEGGGGKEEGDRGKVLVFFLSLCVFWLPRGLGREEGSEGGVWGYGGVWMMFFLVGEVLNAGANIRYILDMKKSLIDIHMWILIYLLISLSVQSGCQNSGSKMSFQGRSHLLLIESSGVFSFQCNCVKWRLVQGSVLNDSYFGVWHSTKSLLRSSQGLYIDWNTLPRRFSRTH